MPLEGLKPEDAGEPGKVHTESRTHRSTRPRSWMIVAIPIMLFLVAEGVTRLILPSSEGVFAFQSTLQEKSHPWRSLNAEQNVSRDGNSITISKSGYRESEAAHSNRIPVLVFGGDSVFGSAMSDEAQTLPAIIESEIDQELGRFSLMNCGVPGIRVADMADSAGPLVERTNAKAVVLVVGIEEILSIAAVRRKERQSASESGFRIAVLDLFSGGRRGKPLLMNPDEKTLHARKVSWTENLRQLVVQAGKAGAGVVLASEPCALSGKREEVEARLSDMGGIGDLDVGAMIRTRKYLAEVMELLAEAYTFVWYEDLGNWSGNSSTGFDQDRYLDSYHPQFGQGLSPAGVKGVGRELAANLLTNVPWLSGGWQSGNE